MPRVIAEDPLAKPSRTQAADIRLRSNGRLEARAHRYAPRVLAQLFLEDIALCAANERVAHLRVMPRVLTRRDIDKTSAGHRHGRAWHSQHESVAGTGRDGPIEIELHPAPGAGGDLVALQDDDTAADLRRPGVKKEIGAVTHGAGRRREDSQRRVDAPGWLDGAWPSQQRTSGQLVLLHSAEVCRHSISGSHRVDLLVVSLQATYPDDATVGHDLHLVANSHRPVDERAGDDRAEAAHREHTVDGKTRPARVRPRRRFLEQCVEGGDKIRETLAAWGRDPDYWRTLQRGAPQRCDDLRRNQLQPPRVGPVDL